jgi:flagellar motor switch protein FliM
MKEILNQQEVDAILGNTHTHSAGAVVEDKRVVERCNFRNPSQMSQGNTRFLTSLYEGFARGVSSALGAYLRARFEMALASVEQVPVRDFLAALQENGFIASLKLEPVSSTVLLQIEAPLVFPIIDVLLGGLGKAAPKTREMTEIDQDIMERVVQVICRHLEASWQPLKLKALLDAQPNPAQMQGIYTPTEKLTILTFEITLNGTSGALSLSFPAVLMSAIVRSISSDPRRHGRLELEAKPKLRERVLECQFPVTLGVRNLQIPLRELVSMKPGSILDLRRSIKVPATLMLGGRDYLEATPVRTGKQRAAQIAGPVTQPSSNPG